MHHWISVVCGPKFTKSFSLNVEVVVVEGVFLQIFDMSIRSGVIRDQTRILQKSTEFCMFLDPNFLGEGPPNFWSGIIKFSQILTMWQSFRAIG